MPHTAVDIIVLIVILISAVLAFIRGFTRESLALGTWLIAAYLSFTQYPHLVPWLQEKITSATFHDSPWLYDFLAGLIIFAGTMLILVPISFYIRSFVKGEQITAVDRSLGFVFGAARGFLLLSIFYLITSWLMPEEKQPDWLKTANTKPALAFGADLIKKLIPQEQRDIIEKKPEKNPEATTEPAADGTEPATAPVVPAEPSKEEPAGSDTDSLKKMLDDVRR
jgi:membrane protein required for colicin V production